MYLLSSPSRPRTALRWALCILVTGLLIWGFCAGLGWRPPARRAQAAPNTVTITLSPSALAGIAEGSPTQSLSPAGGAVIIGWNYRMSVGRRAGLLWFDLNSLPAGITPLKARVKADVTASNGLPTMVAHLSRLGEKWQEGRVAWKNRPPALPPQAQAVLGTAGIAEWDITPWVMDWLAHPEGNLGLLVDSFAEFPESNERTLAGWRLELVLPADALSLHVETDPPAIWPGGTLRYRIRVENTGTTTAVAPHLEAELPVQAYFLTCTDGCAPRGTAYTWDLPALEPGRTHAIFLTVQVPPGARAGDTLLLHLRLSSFASPSSVARTVQTPIIPPSGTPAPTPTPGPSPTPGACDERVTNGGFEEFITGWALEGSAPPFIMGGERHSGFFSLLLGGMGMEQGPADSIAWQRVRIPADAERAILSFWYLLFRPASEVGYDWFALQVTDAAGRTLEQVVPPPHPTWGQRSIDLGAYRGQILYLRFLVHNDGNAGATRAYLDDVSLCVERPAGSEPAPTPYPGICSPRDSAPDYAPAGLPDFSARQSDWVTGYPSAVWAYDGPTALANVLWWLDSRLEGAGEPPPAVADSVPLVVAYGPWDDHDPRNVVPLILDLAERLDTNGLRSGDGHLGTRPEELAGALRAYLAERGLDNALEVEWIPALGFDELRHEVHAGAGVVFLLGFWQWDALAGQWNRIGGRYLSAAGVLCEDDALLASDPLRDGREMGHAGEVMPVEDHPHAGEDAEAVHNDAAFVSHDLYRILRQPEGWGLSGYVEHDADIADSLGANAAADQTQAPLQANAFVTTRVEGALVVRPAAETPAVQVFPALVRHRGDGVVALQARAETGGQPFDRCQLVIQFDPSQWQVVDAEGRPADAVLPGPALEIVDTNHVDPTSGEIRFSAHTAGPPPAGTVVLAALYLRPLTDESQSFLELTEPGPAGCQLWLGGAPILGEVHSGRLEQGPASSLTIAFAGEGPISLWPRPVLLTSAGGPALPAEAVITGRTDNAGQAHLPMEVAPGAWELSVYTPGSLALMTPAHLQPYNHRWNVGTPLWGDINADQQVGMDDLSRLITAWGSQAGTPAFDPPADLDGDGEIGQGDWDLLTPNLERIGPGAAPSEPSPELSWMPASAGAVDWISFSLLPSDTKTVVGGIVPVLLQAIAFGSAPDTVAVHLDYDPNVLQIVDEAGKPAQHVQPADGMDTVLVNRVDNYAGRVDFIAAQRGTGELGSVIDLARFHIRARAPAREAWLRFATSGSRRSTAAAKGQTQGASFHALRAEIGGAQVILPMLYKR